MNKQNPNILLMTAVDTEYKELDGIFDLDYEELINGPFVYEITEYEIFGLKYNLILSMSGQGNTEAAIHVQEAVNRFNPMLVVYIGTCGFIKDVNIGDSVFVTESFDFLRGKEEKAFKSKPTFGFMPYKVRGICESISRSINRGELLFEEYKEKHSKVICGSGGSSPVIVSAEESIMKKIIEDNYANIKIVELEGYGFYRAINELSFEDAILIRAVTDNATNKDNDKDRIIQPEVMKKTCLLALEVIKKYCQLYGSINSTNNNDKNIEALIKHFNTGYTISYIKRALNYKKAYYCAFLDFKNINFDDKIIHLGHCYFIKVIDELLSSGKEVILFLCTSYRNLNNLNIKKQKHFAKNVKEHIIKWEECFSNRVSVIDMGYEIITKHVGYTAIIKDVQNYLARTQKKINNMIYDDKISSIIGHLNKWRRSGEIHGDYLEEFISLLEVLKTKDKITKNEIYSMAYLLIMKPNWYTMDWFIDCIEYFSYCDNFGTNQFIYENSSNIKKIFIESKRNSYVWDAMLFIFKKFKLKNNFIHLPFRTVPNINNNGYMKTSDFNTCICNKDNVSKKKHIDAGFLVEANNMFETKDIIKEDSIYTLINKTIERFK